MRTGLKIAAAAVALVLGGVVLKAALAPSELLRVGAAYSAKMVCSNVFLAGRDAQAVLADDVQAPGNPVLKVMRASVDKDQQLVRAGFFGLFGKGLAVYRPGTGCAVVPDGDIARAAQYRFTSTALPLVDASQPWPVGAQPQTVAAVQALIDQDDLAGPGMRAIAVIHNGQLVAQRYGKGFDANSRLLGWSMTKTVSAALVGLQIADGKLAMNRQGLWHASGDPRAAIAVADLMAMSSGLQYNEGYGAVSDVTRMLYLEPDMAAYTASLPSVAAPGKVWNYSSGTTVLLSRLWQQAASGEPLDGLAQRSGAPSPAWLATLAVPQQRLFAPLGMNSAVMEADARGNLVGSSYMYATAQDWARFGQFLLQDGVWQNRRMLPEGFVAAMREVAPASGGQYGQGQLWRWGPDGDTPEGQNPDAPFHLPPETYWMEGHDGQSIAIVPSQKLVVVRLGLTPHDRGYLPQRMLAAIIRAVQP